LPFKPDLSPESLDEAEPQSPKVGEESRNGFTLFLGSFSAAQQTKGEAPRASPLGFISAGSRAMVYTAKNQTEFFTAGCFLSFSQCNRIYSQSMRAMSNSMLASVNTHSSYGKLRINWNFFAPSAASPVLDSACQVASMQ
jgi:hypothetical protein